VVSLLRSHLDHEPNRGKMAARALRVVGWLPLGWSGLGFLTGADRRASSRGQ